MRSPDLSGIVRDSRIPDPASSPRAPGGVPCDFHTLTRDDAAAELAALAWAILGHTATRCDACGLYLWPQEWGTPASIAFVDQVTA